MNRQNGIVRNINRQALLDNQDMGIPPSGAAWLPWAMEVLVRAATAPLRGITLAGEARLAKKVTQLARPMRPMRLSPADVQTRILHTLAVRDLGSRALAAMLHTPRPAVLKSLGMLREQGKVVRLGWARQAVWGLSSPVQVK